MKNTGIQQNYQFDTCTGTCTFMYQENVYFIVDTIKS